MLKNRISYLLILLVVFLFFVCYNGYISYYVLLVALALPLLSLLLSLPGILGIRLEFQAEEPSAQKGQSVPLRLTISNALPFVSGRARVTLRTQNILTGEIQEEHFGFTASQSPLTIVHQLTSPLCGQVVCQLRRGRVCDYMGIFAFPMRLSRCPRQTVVFYPTVHSPLLSLNQVPQPNSESDAYSQTKPGDDPSELFGLRNYREGDKLSRVHWKLSQKTGGLLIKEFGYPIAEHLLFLLEPGSGQEADLLLDAFATLSHFLSQQEAPHRAALRGGDGFSMKEITDEESRRPVLNALLSLGKTDTLQPVSSQKLFSGVSHIVYLCHTPEEGTVRSVLQQAPFARFSILTTASDPSAINADLPGGTELISLRPGQITETLNGFQL